MLIQRLLTNVSSRNIEESTQFYTSLFSFDIAFESDWFVNLVAQGSQFEIGIIDKDHPIVPDRVKGEASGVYMTFVVENVDVVHAKALKMKYEIIQAPELTFYGQKRMLLQAPEGTVCDVSSMA